MVILGTLAMGQLVREIDIYGEVIAKKMRPDFTLKAPLVGKFIGHDVHYDREIEPMSFQICKKSTGDALLTVQIGADRTGPEKFGSESAFFDGHKTVKLNQLYGYKVIRP